ncbi:hypothetical protein CDAR_219901 [Caerostris darwini]|uniref:Uncharacterized protein n=1 Tax=Caerostris darwini TaxID=1538125 RepID=A0AAV4VIN8_9ARAC|nr:hypothetical protein CDAR_219901 [Caerostris darwini]
MSYVNYVKNELAVFYLQQKKIRVELKCADDPSGWAMFGRKLYVSTSLSITSSRVGISWIVVDSYPTP